MADKKRTICPLTYRLFTHTAGDFDYCVKEQCAWWDILAGDCAITVIAKLGLEGSFNAITKEIRK